jgi:hypothetical protein
VSGIVSIPKPDRRGPGTRPLPKNGKERGTQIESKVSE